MAALYLKDPDAVLDYKFDWAAKTNGTGQSDWLTVGETILAANATVAAAPGGAMGLMDSGGGGKFTLNVDDTQRTDNNTSVTVWLSGGVDGVDYLLTCNVQTSAGRTDDRSMLIRVRSR